MGIVVKEIEGVTEPAHPLSPRQHPRQQMMAMRALIQNDMACGNDILKRSKF
jgi:hypothetical protein